MQAGVIWLLKDFDLLSVILRALVFALEALTLGGVAFLLCAALPAHLHPAVLRSLHRSAAWAAFAFAAAQAAATALSVAILVGGSGLPLASVTSAGFFIAGASGAGCALIIALLLRTGAGKPVAAWLAVVPAAGALFASVAMSHAASRLDDRAPLILLTALHHLGMAGWVGAMAFLMLTLRESQITSASAAVLARRYSRMAMVSAPMLALAGIGLSYAYVHSWAGMVGTSYGVMVTAKVYLVLTMLLLGASNQRMLRSPGVADGTSAAPFLLRVRRFAEAEIGLGFTAILAAASLTSQAPAVDVPSPDQLTPHQIVERLRWQSPRLASPPVAALAPPASLEAALPSQQFGTGTVNDANDRAWSEYNHHWAGLIVLAAGLMALAARLADRSPTRLAGFGYAQGEQSSHRQGSLRQSLQAVLAAWPLLFLGLAAFILLRADPENWPLGPRPFWASFSRPDVLEHRVYALLLAAFAVFEWAVQRGRIRSRYAAWFFPLVCAAGGGALLTHSHALGSMQDEMLAELSHTPIALLGATAGWSRWLELRLPDTRPARIVARVWPLCLALIGLVLLDYRES